MVDDKHDNRFGVADELRALGEVRSALEAVEREQNRVLEDRRDLRMRLEGLLEALREDALVLRFDAERGLVDASGSIEEQLGVSAAELVSSFEEFVDEETVDALDEANRAVLDEASSGASVSDGFLRTADEDLAVTWIHVRRWDEEGELNGTEAIGLLAPLADADDEELGADGDPFEDLLEQVSRRLLDDVGETSITGAAQMFGDFFSADRVVINRYDDDARKFAVLSSWLRGDTQPLDAEVRGIAISELPWAYSALGAGEAVLISAAADLPDDAAAERELYAGDGTQASLLVPMSLNDRLTGFLSIQSIRQEREWGESDVRRAQQFALVLSAALARAEAGDALAGARSDLQEASEKCASAETRAQEAEASASEAQQKLDDLTAETDAVRAEIENLKEDTERVQRRSEDTAADALVVRTELEDMRAQLEEARSDAAEARAELRQLRDAGGTPIDDIDVGAPEPADVDIDTPESESVATDVSDPAEAGDYDPDATMEMNREKVEAEAFNPDATLEMQALSAESEEVREEAAPPEAVTEQETEAETETGEFGDPAEATVELELPSRLEDVDSEELPRAVSLDEMLERAPAAGTREVGGTTWKADKAGWEDSTDEVALPEFLETDDDEAGGSDDEGASGSEEADAELAGDDADEGAPAVDNAEEGEGVARGGVTGDVEAAQRLARQVAGKDEGDIDEADAEEMTELDTEMEAEQTDTEQLDTELPPVTLPDPIELSIDEMDTADEPRTQEPIVGEPAVPDAPAAKPAAQMPDLAGIDAVAGLQDVGGKVELYHTLLTKFRDDYIGAAAKIDSAIEKGNIEVAHLLLHAVKGVAGNLGVTGVRDAADDLEARLIGDDSTDTKKAIEDFTAALDGALDSIATLGNDTVSPAPPMEEPSAPPPEANVSEPMVLRSYLSGLRQHLLAEKLRQCQLVMREITTRNWPSDYSEQVALLAGFIEEERFAEARATFDELMDQFPKD